MGYRTWITITVIDRGSMTEEDAAQAFDKICEEACLNSMEKSREDLQMSGEDNNGCCLELVTEMSKSYPELLFDGSVDGASEDSDDQRQIRIRNGEIETVYADITYAPFKKILTKEEDETRRRLQSRNRIELLGSLGQVCVREIDGETCGVLLLATNITYLADDGRPVFETSWHKVILRDQVMQDQAKKMQQGDRVRVTGRVHYRNETLPSGVDVVSFEIIAQSVEVVGRPDQHLDPENIDGHQSPTD
jgi:single-stranded DNA-binding protein